MGCEGNRAGLLYEGRVHSGGLPRCRIWTTYADWGTHGIGTRHQRVADSLSAVHRRRGDDQHHCDTWNSGGGSGGCAAYGCVASVGWIGLSWNDESERGDVDIGELSGFWLREWDCPDNDSGLYQHS